MKAYQGSDIGKIRAENQDSLASKCYEDGLFALVCDGMGGMLSGSAASSGAILAAAQLFDERYQTGMENNALCDLLRECAAAANKEVFRMSVESGFPGSMGTTLVGIFMRHSHCCIVNVGDSRAYLLPADGSIRQLTTDHTFVQHLYEQGEITAEERMTHERRNELTRAIGVQKSVLVDTFCMEMADGDRILLCSDGLYGMVSEERMAELINHTEPEQVPEECIREANENGGRDNITLILAVRDA
ncbi:MAG: serine/threonine-protein phosphatase [Oscillospiraceae bacterium]|nr:serine/threonine-protein phosphatase [Oscillospiraceae bacterium]